MIKDKLGYFLNKIVFGQSREKLKLKIPYTSFQKHREYSEKTRWDCSCFSPLGFLTVAHDI
jgi:hypothetical protein